MTRAVRDRLLKDTNGDISDHLHNHIHLTNCIHLKNHMHKHSPVMADMFIMRDLMVLQRSRSLRDPSASPPSWHSPTIVDLLPRKGDNDVMIREGRRSFGAEHRRDSSRLSGSSRSPRIPKFVTSKVAPGDAAGLNDTAPAPAISEQSSKSGNRDCRRVRREESSRKSRTDLCGGNGDSGKAPEDQDGNHLVHNIVPGNSETEDRKSRQKGKQTQDVRAKTLSEQLNDIPMDSDDLVSSNVQFHGGRSQLEKTGEEPLGSIRGYSNGLNRVKRRKFRGSRRPRAASALRDIGGQREMSVASNSLMQGSARPKYYKEEKEEGHGKHNVTRAPRNGCGVPWNWSRIHHRGKTFLDKAGRSFTSCGLSDSRIRKAGSASHGRDVPDLPVESDRSSSYTNSDAEALPLLEASGSQSAEHAGWVHDYSGELGIFADHLLKHDIDSDLASEGRSGDQHKLGVNRNGRHQNLTQKYMPRTFRDLVGQNLVAQALSNAVMRRKVGLLYVFYGPHGTGKTSCARIFARALNCQSLEQPKPCGFCHSCVSHDMGKSRNIKEVGPVSNFDFESILDLLDNMVTSRQRSQYRIFVLDDCDTLSPDCWSAISKVIDRAPRRVAFILVCSSLDALPHIIISRCQKFFFPKLKDADIIYTLQWIASKEDVEIDKDALKLVASRSDGSLRDAEMTLEQLSLLGQRISVPLVQELVGLISDEKLVDLLDLALSADTVNTVKNLRVIMETGVEPLALMSQLATIITDVLVGSYDFTKDRHRRKFFRRQPLSKEEMEKLRQALKTLSDAEKQLRMSNDKLTWLTAALLQLAPDPQYVLPDFLADNSFSHSPSVLENACGRDVARKGGERSEISNKETGMPMNVRLENFHAEPLGDFSDRSMMKRHAGSRTGMAQRKSPLSTHTIRVSGRRTSGKSRNGIEEIWLEVLNKIQNNGIKEFLYQEGKLISVSFGAAPTAQLTFSSLMSKSKAEKFKDQILRAFESVLGSPLTIEIRCESTTDTVAGFHPLELPASDDGLSQMVIDSESNVGTRGPIGISKRVSRDRGINGASSQALHLRNESLEMGRSEIVEVPSSPREIKDNDDNGKALSERTELGEQSQCQSIVRSKVSLAHVIQQTEGCTQRNGWSKRKAVSIAEKLEQENLRMEPRSRSLHCWKASTVTRRKLCRLKIRTRKPHSLLKLVCCGKCLSSKSPK